MDLWQAAVLGVVEGLTEFLPVSSTGHLTIVERLMGMKTDSASLTAFTAVIQVGAILAAVLYFRTDIVRIVVGWVRGLFRPAHRGDFDYKFGWYVILGSIPIGVAGVVGKSLIESVLRSLWFVVAGLLLWSVVIWLAEKYASQRRTELDVGWRDALFVGVAQVIALVPGVSRSGATISAGLVRGLDRVTATRLSFFLGIPALAAAGVYELKDAVATGGIGWLPTLVGTVVSFLVAYAAVAWFLRFVTKHSLTTFIWYRVPLGILLAVLLLTGTIDAT
ncbi:undecaprenyl-diphosphate phosphatase [Actinocatenispora rupis]|uniref:Undecaprenyl-diphosphatase n=1 Tax=Actinocatenispora rupis TaxID=519421 RepID=A0A8J3JA85_9ACTN|nr:undecaprenyl-diphosphate phosphatase [Actinocatenispora rupis]GID11088.1 undecaprenyl-diphosphatase 1 [Actinocatenispora rupis]